MVRRPSKSGRRLGIRQPSVRRRKKSAENPPRQRQWLAGVAVLVSLVALIPAFWDNLVLRSSDLSIAGIKATTKTDVPVTEHGPMGDAPGSSIIASAVAITLKNEGEQPALIKRVRLSVDQVWAPRGCDGAGSTTYTIAYDFVLPGDIESRPLPYVLEKDYQFQVAGQEIDGMLIPIGQELFGEAGWPLVVAGTLELIQDDGKSLKTEPFVLMDGHRNDDIVSLSNNTRGDDSYEDPRKVCVEKNLGMLRSALERPGPKSSSITDLLERIKPRQVIPSRDPEPAKPGERDVDTWVAQLASLPGATPEAEAIRRAKEIASSTGWSLRVIWSTYFESLREGYWVVYYPGSFKDGHAALDACKRAGRTDPESCVGRYLSHREADRDLVCYFSDPQDARRCKR
ncbi:hypothetical protein [Lentzea aerocolonigenes]|uniref:hypothetical protein n=1 Tax=Lentzea aerocolonigenes TaxID=68170 RepID=UPI000A4A9A9B|nr:hypothetical protein [Lentzea aerocolonigenes]MCP2245749.1 hypothetical protein [Lentzea aerocolonigenes]